MDTRKNTEQYLRYYKNVTRIRKAFVVVGDDEHNERVEGRRGLIEGSKAYSSEVAWESYTAALCRHHSPLTNTITENILYRKLY